MSYTKTTWVNNTTPIDENNLNKIESGIENNDINIGEENYDNTKTYEVGDIVRYNEKIYKCITAITTAENFDISKWEQTNIVEIVQSEKSKIYELIEAISTPIVGEGENITLNDTAEKRFENFDIEGNSEQETREGYQLLNLQSGMQNGITYYVDDEGYFYISGTCTSDRIVLNLNELVLNGTYIFTNKSISGGEINCVLKDNTPEYRNVFTKNNETKEVNTILKDLVCYLTNGATYNSKVKLMLVSGSQEKDIEQYGASPSPDYPSEVECCGDNVNLFDKDNMTIGKIWSGATLLDSDVGNASPKIPVTAGKTYIRNTGYSSNYIIKEDNSVVDIQGGTNAITMPEDSKYWIFNIPKDIDINTIKAEEGLISTPYSPYGQGCINEVICNKNLFDKESVLTGTAIQRNTGNILTTSAYSTYSTSDYCKVKSSTTYFLGIAYSSTNFGVVYYDKDKNHISGEKLNNYFTTPSNCEYVRFTWITADYNISTIQLEEGTTATDYVEHKSQTYTIPTQQPMRAIGNVRDKFILKENGKWYERHYIFRKIFDGTETFTKETRNEVTNFYMFLEGFGSQKGYCNILPVVNSDSYIANILFIWSKLNGFSMMFDTSRFGTLSDYKSYLKSLYDAGTPAYLDYVLKEPLDIECTSEQTEILNQIYIKAKSYKGVTHIYSNDAVSPNCYVEAVKDLTTLIQ